MMNVHTSKSKTVLATTCSTHIVQDGVSSTVIVLLPILAQAFGFSYAQVGLLKGLKSLAQAALEMGSGWMSERVGERRLIAVGLVLSGMGYLLLSFAMSAFLVATCLLIVGAGTALHHAPSSALIATGYSPTSRISALGVYNASGDVGKLVFTGLFSLAIGAGLAWQQISLVYGLICILVASGIAVVARGSARSKLQDNVEKPAATGKPSAKGWGILNWPSFGALLMVTSVDTMVQSSVLVFVAFLMLAKGLSIPFAIGTTVLLLVGGVFGKAGCGYLADRIGVAKAFSLVQTLTALGLVAVIVTPVWLAAILLVPLGAVVQGTSSITYGFAAGLIDQRKMARGYALLYSSGTLASAIGPLTIGVVADEFGIRVAIYVVAAIAMLAIPPIFLLRSATA